MHSLHHSLMSEARPGQKKRLLTSLVVAPVPACERECTCSNTALRWLLGISGLILPVEMSHHTLTECIVIFYSCSEEVSRTALIPGHVAWSAATSFHLSGPVKAGGATTSTACS